MDLVPKAAVTRFTPYSVPMNSTSPPKSGRVVVFQTMRDTHPSEKATTKPVATREKLGWSPSLNTPRQNGVFIGGWEPSPFIANLPCKPLKSSAR